ncbi:MAG TPA: sigma 54-interacting transcriptional regulator [Clostridium sp.]|uniref:sigma 54-interacting transcriptional regulator n=1 Tax=Clostridium sp. TaxID=1506 RepID=UPI002F93923C
MKPILIIAPHTKIQCEAKKVADNYYDVDVELALLDDAIKIAKYAENHGVEVIISRGGTARIIENAVTVPVIEIQVSPYDMLSAIYTAKKYGKNIFIIGFKNVIEKVHLSGPILDINIHAYEIDNEEDGNVYIKNLINSGTKIDALLGGTVAENLAIKYNIHTVFLETGTTSIEFSINEARKIAEVSRKEKEKTEKIKAILHYISEGIIAIDRERRITTFNSSAEKIMGISNKDAIGQLVDELIPDTKLSRVIEKNKPELGRLQQIGKTQVLVNRVPIIIKGKTVGAVATFQDVTKIQEYEQRIRAKLLSKGNVAKYDFSKIIGKSKNLLKTKEKAKKYASNDSTVLIVGESGTGKEMFAQSIHLESIRKNGPFVAVNCAAINQNLLESELFGYEEGAFTGAKKTGKTGLFVEAHGGTIFLDEIGEIGIELQASLLRVLQERGIRPIGSSKVIPVDIRIIAATNKNLLQEIEKGDFRSDLYYRLNILKLQVPTLRDRKDDIKMLIEHFACTISLRYNKNVEISKEAIEKLQGYNWTGNIRELENVIERLVVLNDNIITGEQVKEVIDEEIEEANYENSDYKDENVDSLEEVKKRHIYKILSECGDNQTLTASRLGISRTHLWRIINNYK